MRWKLFVEDTKVELILIVVNTKIHGIFTYANILNVISKKPKNLNNGGNLNFPDTSL